VLGGMAGDRGSAPDLVRQLGITTQAAGLLIDTLIVRGYLERRESPDDPRRTIIELTGQGRAAAEAVGAGVEAVDAELAQLVSPAELAGLRTGLVALTEIRERMEGEAS
jgi:DNA-binding MarR family transcriptional regulator